MTMQYHRTPLRNFMEWLAICGIQITAQGIYPHNLSSLDRETGLIALLITLGRQNYQTMLGHWVPAIAKQHDL